MSTSKAMEMLAKLGMAPAVVEGVEYLNVATPWTGESRDNIKLRGVGSRAGANHSTPSTLPGALQKGRGTLSHGLS